MKLTPDTFVIADLHFGHKNIIQYETRPEDYEELTVAKWNQHVEKHDQVLVLGDLTLAGRDYTKKYTERLHGKKFLIKGNHDGNTETFYLECGFTVVEPILKTFANSWGKLRVLFTHEPVEPLPEGWFNIHGHVHARELEYTERHCNVGADVTNYIPVRIYEVLALWKHLSSEVSPDRTR